MRNRTILLLILIGGAKRPPDTNRQRLLVEMPHIDAAVLMSISLANSIGCEAEISAGIVPSILAEGAIDKILGWKGIVGALMP
jgi:hypothetical protein